MSTHITVLFLTPGRPHSLFLQGPQGKTSNCAFTSKAIQFSTYVLHKVWPPQVMFVPIACRQTMPPSYSPLPAVAGPTPPPAVSVLMEGGDLQLQLKSSRLVCLWWNARVFQLWCTVL